MSELNPENKVVKAAHGQWHKIAALIMFKCGINKLDIKDKDVDDFNKIWANIAIQDSKGYTEVFLLTQKETDDILKKDKN